MLRILVIVLVLTTFCQAQTKSSMDSVHSMHSTHFRPMSPVTSASKGTDSLNRVHQVNLKDFSFIKKYNNTIRPTVLIFLGSDCPISQKYGNTLRNLYSGYKETVSFYGVFPKSFNYEEITNFKQMYQIEFDLISDKGNELAKKLGASYTPETYLITESGKIVYQGAIDNWFYELGKNRRQVTEHYLEDAIKSALEGSTPKVSFTQAIGCFIEYKD